MSARYVLTVFCFCVLLTAAEKISLDLVRIPLTEAVRKTGIPVNGLAELFPPGKIPRITVHLKNVTPAQALKAMLQCANLDMIPDKENFRVCSRKQVPFVYGTETSLQYQKNPQSENGEFSVMKDIELPGVITGMPDTEFYREFNQKIKITAVNLKDRSVTVEFSGKKETLKEGNDISDMIRILEILSADEVLVFYPRMQIRKTVKVTRE